MGQGFGAVDPVQVFGRRYDDPFHALWRPASKKRQGTKSREVGHRRCCGRYGDLMAAPGSRVDVTPTGCGRRISPLARLEAYSRHLSKRLKQIKERTARRPRRPGREGSLPAWGQRIGTGKWRRSRAVWLMMCRSCWASDATSARSRVRTPQSRSCGRHSAYKGNAAHVACPWRYPAALAGRRQAERC
jgi:hypothetical protein